MKKFLFLLPLACGALLFSCSDDDSASPEAEFTGIYQLTQASGSIAGGSYEYDPGLITWSFNPSNNTVTIVNNNVDPMAYDGPDTGIYTYSVEASEVPDLCDTVLKIDGVDYGCYMITTNGLTVSNTYVDGYTFSFQRMAQPAQ